jgi:PIN domain nuclease of toxin-antitoxin system
LILLDTVTLVWFTLADRRLGATSRSLIDADNELIVCAITPWEVAMLTRKRRLDLGQSPLAWIKGILTDPRVRLVSINPETGIAAGLLPESIHGDPADRLIIATSNELGCPILTPDEKLLAYAAQGLVHAIDARL